MKKLGVYSIFSLFILSGLFVMFYAPNTAVLAPIDGIDDGGGLKSPKTSDVFEDNDIIDDNVTLTVGVLYPNLICDDFDWYRVWGNNKELITVYLYFIHDDGNLVVDLYWNDESSR